MGTLRGFMTELKESQHGQKPARRGVLCRCHFEAKTQIQMEAHIPHLPRQLSGAQMNRGATGTTHTYSFVYICMSSNNIDVIQNRVNYNFSSQMSVSLMNRMAIENPQPNLVNHMNDSNMNLIPQNPAAPTTWKKHQKRTSLMHAQHKQLEAVFSHTMFPDKNLQKELALKLNLPKSAIKIWFRNRRVKMKKQQQQQQLPLKRPNQILSAKNVPTSPTTSTSPYSYFPVVSDYYSSLLPQPFGPSSLALDSVITESPTSDVQMQDPQLESLMATVPTLFPDAYDIEQIMELYSFPDEDETSNSFHSLDQYLAPTGPSWKEKGSSLSIFADAT